MGARVHREVSMSRRSTPKLMDVPLLRPAEHRSIGEDSLQLRLNASPERWQDVVLGGIREVLGMVRRQLPQDDRAGCRVVPCLPVLDGVGALLP